MKNALRKDFIREIKNNKGRFFSILMIVLLGAAFFSGMRTVGGQMKYTADVYYDQTDLMDIRVLSTLGLTDEDVAEIAALPLVESVVGGLTKEAILCNSRKDFSVKLIAQTTDVNKVHIDRGREPRLVDECLMDQEMMEDLGYELGDKVVLRSGTDNPLEDDLTQTEFVIVGGGDLPYYLDLSRGVGTIGDGSLEGFLVVLPEAFDMDYYSEIYVKVDGAEELSCYSDAYKEQVQKAVDEIEGISEEARQRRYEELYQDGTAQIEEGKQEIADAEDELADAKKQLDDGKKELEDVKEQLEEGKEQLDDAQKELEEGEDRLKEVKQELDAGEKELAEGKEELDTAESQVNSADAELGAAEQELLAAKAQLDAGAATLNATKTQLDAGKAQLDASKAQLDAGEKELQENEALLAEKRAELDAGWAEYNAGAAELEEKAEKLARYRSLYDTVYSRYLELKERLEPGDESIRQALIFAFLDFVFEVFGDILDSSSEKITDAELLLAEVRTQLDDAEAAIADGQAQLEAARVQLEEGEVQYQDGLVRYEAGKAQYDAGLAEYESGLSQYEAGLAQYEAGYAQYLDGLARYEAGKAQYEAGKAELEAGKKQYETGKKELEDGKKQYADSVQEYEEGLEKYNDGLKEWEEGNAEYEANYEDAQRQIADAKIEISKAEKELAKLGVPTWYILDRDKISSVVSFGQDAGRLDSLGNVFPVLFFLVAALVSLTAMTRMVEEQRQQIGTLKALGYSGGAIAGKYLGYAMLATLIGAVVGVLFGEKVLPWTIMNAYQALYSGLPVIYQPYNWTQGILAIALSVLCTGAAAFSACYRKLKDVPAELMRPETPGGGKRIFLEYVTFLWKRLTFSQKSTLRNLFRYKKRFFMTLFGISGCMGLLLVGYGLWDSITVVAKNQFVEIFQQDATVSVDTSSSQTDLEQLQAVIDGVPGMLESMHADAYSVTLSANQKDISANLIVPEDTDQIFDFVRFRDRKTMESYPYPTEGAAMSEKTADMLGLSIGDIFTIQRGDNTDPVPVELETIVENYVMHYVFLSPETYERVFGEAPEYNAIYLKYEDNSKEAETEMGSLLMEQEACIGISFVTDLENTIDDMLDVLHLIIYVLIGSAAVLTFVVFYNLNSINMMERKRELATLKVLGFRDMEVAMYVYRENIILTLFGIVAGMFLGTILFLFTITTVEVDLMMFGRVVSPGSYALCAVLTFAFSMTVNIVMYYHFRKIDMVESLKSVE